MINILDFFSLSSSNIIPKLITFKRSLLFYPVIFTLMAVLLFIFTSAFDHIKFTNDLSFDAIYVDPLIFTGSSNAAQSILSTIASGWATILGVAYSVTLITLQLATSKYTSHIIDRFEQDKINQITLGWFIFAVSYSLLVLKTVRTTDLDFTPILGVNVAVIIAIIGLFIFVIFLKNISSYLRPNILSTNITEQIIHALRSYEKRIPESISFDKLDATKILEIRSKKQGIITHIDWEKIIQTILTQISARGEINADSTIRKEKENDGKIDGLWMEWSKTVGESVNKRDLLSTLYKYDKNNITMYSDLQKSNIKQKGRNNKVIDKENDLDDDLPYKENTNEEKNDSLTIDIISAIQISDDRTLNTDPLYGIDLLQSIAIKASYSRDIDVAISCISGLFKVMLHSLKTGEKMGIPFTIFRGNKKKLIISDSYKQNKKLKVTKDNAIGKSLDNTKEKIQGIDVPFKESHNKTVNQNGGNSLSLIINPKEIALVDVIMSELSLINSSCCSNDKAHIINHIITEYKELSKYLLESNKIDEFIKITKWISSQIENVVEIFYPELRNVFIVKPLDDFKEKLSEINNAYAYKYYISHIDPIIKRYKKE